MQTAPDAGSAPFYFPYGQPPRAIPAEVPTSVTENDRSKVRLLFGAQPGVNWRPRDLGNGVTAWTLLSRTV